MTHGQCNARPTFTFSASDHHCPLAGTNLYCLVNRGTMAHVCEQLAQSRYVKRSDRDLNLRPIDCKPNALTTMPHLVWLAEIQMLHHQRLPSVTTSAPSNCGHIHSAMSYNHLFFCHPLNLLTLMHPSIWPCTMFFYTRFASRRVKLCISLRCLLSEKNMVGWC